MVLKSRLDKCQFLGRQEIRLDIGNQFRSLLLIAVDLKEVGKHGLLFRWERRGVELIFKAVQILQSFSFF